VAMSTFGSSRRVPSSAIAEIEENKEFWTYLAQFCFDFDDLSFQFEGTFM